MSEAINLVVDELIRELRHTRARLWLHTSPNSDAEPSPFAGGQIKELQAQELRIKKKIDDLLSRRDNP